jgi:hypothetical protein
MGTIPIVAVVGWRWWPYLMVLPVTVLPIAGKTVRELVYSSQAIGAVAGWIVYLVLPVMVTTIAAVWLQRRSAKGHSGLAFARRALLLSAWTLFLLNYAFFRFPWPWTTWTGRTPNGIIFTVCVLGLTALALRRKEDAPAEP